LVYHIFPINLAINPSYYPSIIDFYSCNMNPTTQSG
jgi:hypothetical protein